MTDAGQRLPVHAGRQRGRWRLGRDEVQVGHHRSRQPLRAASRTTSSTTTTAPRSRPRTDRRASTSFDHNFALRGIGEPNDSVSEARMAMGTEGVGFWFRGPNNYVRNNVAANFQNPTTEAAYGFVVPAALPRQHRGAELQGRDGRVAVHDPERQQHAGPAVREQRSLRRDAGRLHALVGELAGSAARRATRRKA